MEHFFPRIQVKTQLFSPNSGEDQKKIKRSLPDMEHFCTDLLSDVHQSQIIGGDADEDYTQIVGGYTVKLLGSISPHPPLVSAPLLQSKLATSLRHWFT